MNKKMIKIYILSGVFLMIWTTFFNNPVIAGEVLKYSSSAQVREAFGLEGLIAFTKETGVKVNLYTGSSGSALRRLMEGNSDLASSAERLDKDHQKYGYVEIPFCKAPLIVITNVKTPVKNIYSLQLQSIFDGTINNWKELGGPDKNIIRIIPEIQTAAFKNFKKLTLRQFDVYYEFMAFRSTDVVMLVHRIPWSISFIGQGVHTANQAVRIINIDNISPLEDGYPYYQIFSFVTKGRPTGNAKKLIDFAFSEKGKTIMLNNGLMPLPRK